MSSFEADAIYSVALFTSLDVLHGEIICAAGVRLLDIFNRTGSARCDFLEFNDGEKSEPDRQRSYIRKDSVLLLALSEANQGRGVGANINFKSFPFVQKTARSVILQLQKYQILGLLHLCQGQTSQDLLNEEKQFLPLTQAVIGNDHNEFFPSPFVIVNKCHLMRLWDHQAVTIPEPALT